MKDGKNNAVKTMKKSIFLLLSVVALLISTQINAFACSCPTIGGTLEQHIKWKLKDSKAVFSGKVIEINDKPQSRDFFVKIKVEKLWKGSLSEEVVITTERSTASCGYPFEVGKNYLVYTHGSGAMNLTTGLCMNNLELQKATEELKILGKGKKPRKRNG